MNKEKLVYFIGSFFLLVAVLLLTVIPMFLDNLEFFFMPEAGDFFRLSFFFIVLGIIMYAGSFDYYKKQIIWFLFLFAFFAIFEICYILSSNVALF